MVERFVLGPIEMEADAGREFKSWIKDDGMQRKKQTVSTGAMEEEIKREAALGAGRAGQSPSGLGQHEQHNTATARFFGGSSTEPVSTAAVAQLGGGDGTVEYSCHPDDPYGTKPMYTKIAFMWQWVIIPIINIAMPRIGVLFQFEYITLGGAVQVDPWFTQSDPALAFFNACN